MESRDLGISGSRISGCRISDSDLVVDAGDVQIWRTPFGRAPDLTSSLEIAGPLPSRAWIMEYMVGWERGPIRGVYPPWLRHPGYTRPPHPALAVADPAHSGSRSVLWALKGHCVTLYSHLKSI